MSDNVKPITMSAEMLDAIRGMLARNPEHVSKNSKLLLAEVDALRARVAELEAALADERKHADGPMLSTILAARKALCMAAVNDRKLFDHIDATLNAHAARRAKEAAND